MKRHIRKWLPLLCIALAVLLAGCAGGGSGDDGSAETPTANGASEQTETPTPNATGPGTEPSESDPLFSELFDSEDSYRFSGYMEYSDRDERAQVEGRLFDGDFYQRVEYSTNIPTTEIYQVGTQRRFVNSEGCFGQGGDEVSEPQDYSDSEFAEQDLEPNGTTTIDGETAYIYETDELVTDYDGSAEYERPFAYYLSAETGYLLKFEAANIEFTYSDWGNAEPITLPC